MPRRRPCIGGTGNTFGQSPAKVPAELRGLPGGFAAIRDRRAG